MKILVEKLFPSVPIESNPMDLYWGKATLKDKTHSLVFYNFLLQMVIPSKWTRLPGVKVSLSGGGVKVEKKLGPLLYLQEVPVKDDSGQGMSSVFVQTFNFLSDHEPDVNAIKFEIQFVPDKEGADASMIADSNVKLSITDLNTKQLASQVTLHSQFLFVEKVAEVTHQSVHTVKKQGTSLSDSVRSAFSIFDKESSTSSTSLESVPSSPTSTASSSMSSVSTTDSQEQKLPLLGDHQPDLASQITPPTAQQSQENAVEKPSP